VRGEGSVTRVPKLREPQRHLACRKVVSVSIRKCFLVSFHEVGPFSNRKLLRLERQWRPGPRNKAVPSAPDGRSGCRSSTDRQFFVMVPLALIAFEPPTLRLLERPPTERFHRFIAISNRVPVIRISLLNLMDPILAPSFGSRRQFVPISF
jgi:hypothetical protein